MVTLIFKVISILGFYLILYQYFFSFSFQLLGHIDVDTREWTDGVLTFSARQVVKETVEVQSWIVCDGDIDPEWIESLNSVLDDNRSVDACTCVHIHVHVNVLYMQINVLYIPYVCVVL